MRFGHRLSKWWTKRRRTVASGSQRCSEEMDAAISTPLELDAWPPTYEGPPAAGDDAGQGPLWVCQKSAGGGSAPGRVSGSVGRPPFWGRETIFSYKGVGKNGPLFAPILHLSRRSPCGSGITSWRVKCHPDAGSCD